MRGTSSIGRKHRGFIAALLALVLFTVPVLYGHAANIDLDKDCTLTIKPASDIAEDISGAGVVVDLYYIASAKAVDGFDTYDLEAEADFASVDIALSVDKTEADWVAAAQEAAAVALAEGSSIAPVVEGADLNTTITGLKAGLYLVVPHGDLDPYVETIQNEDGSEVLVTIANSATNKYSFTPNLIALPTKEGEEGVINTADEGEWITDGEVTLKAGFEKREGSVEIVKSFTTFAKKNDDPVTCVFYVKVYDENGEEQKDLAKTVSMVFETGEEQVELIEGIPVGYTVTVTEEYSGANYTLVSENDQSVVIAADEVLQVEFENEFDDTWHGSGSITNTFTVDEDAWQLEQNYDRAR